MSVEEARVARCVGVLNPSDRRCSAGGSLGVMGEGVGPTLGRGGWRGISPLPPGLLLPGKEGRGGGSQALPPVVIQRPGG